MVIEHKSLLMKRLANLWTEQKEELSAKVNELSESLLEQIASLDCLAAKYRQLKKECASHKLLKKIDHEYKELKKSWQNNLLHWNRLSRNILNMAAALLA